MASNIVGSIEPYVPGASFTNYVERLGFVFQYNNVPESSQKALFITLSGPAVFEELKLLYPARDLSTLQYAEIIKKLKERFDKKESDLIQRFKFYNRVQGEDESAENFVLAVKLQAEFCEFGEFKDTAIRDKFLMGVFNKDLQQKMLSEENLTLASAERMLVNWELAGSRARMISGRTEQVASVKNRLGRRDEYLNERNGRNRSRSRSRSGFHMRNRSRSNNRDRSRSRSKKYNYNKPVVSCYFCGKPGHILKRCFKYINSQRKPTVRFADEPQPGTSAESNLEQLFSRFKPMLDDSSDDSVLETWC
ncbi:uncharacterized protein LOC129730199 [Wyeomyia smithii]|uniref:uncharacterized protein LOC129730199 n=1 Tax=Wyeomyia smithii TaxID=174621 RepID=UPI002468107F|nr:uncharacterized protein LOC129730199 [Wyeomyia smithii]